MAIYKTLKKMAWTEPMMSHPKNWYLPIRPGKLDSLFHISSHFLWDPPPQLSLFIAFQAMPQPLLMAAVL